MGFTPLQILWLLLPVFTPTAQGLVKLNLSPKITAECGKQVILNCSTSSSQPGLSIKHMEWFRDKTSLCSVDSEGIITTPQRNVSSAFHCEYENGRLLLILHKVLPMESGHSKRYRCKLRSNQGAPQDSTTVQLQECSGTVEPHTWSDGLSCTFKHVHPDGDVHWFYDSHNLSGGSVQHYTHKQVDEEGWLTIRSDLDWKKDPQGTFNCSLMSTRSGRHIASATIETAAKGPSQRSNSNGGRAQESMGTVFCVLIFLAVMK